MSSSNVFFLLSIITLIWPTLGATCSPRAIQLPFRNNRMITQAEARGVLWQIGGPTQQNVNLMPSAWYNDTYLWGAGWGYCPSAYSAVVCATYRGGLYDRSTSQTENDAGNLVAHTFDDTIANWTKDDVKLADNTSLPQYEFALRTNSINSYVHKGELGLAKTSTFLKTLQDNAKTSSNSYSFFWGNEVTDQPRDGSLTLGGYDQAIVADGANLTSGFTDDSKCKEGIIVNITGVALEGNKNVWEGLPGLRVCIIAATSNIMSIPGQYWDPIQAAMGVELYPFRNGTAETYFYNTTIVKKDSATYTGDLAITVNDAATFTIPNNQLLFGERYIASTGLVQTKPDVKQIPIVRIAQGDGMMPRIGGMFFSSAYLVVNHDKQQFTIAPAQAKSAPSKLVAFDTANNCIGTVEAAAASTTSGAPQSSSGTNVGGSSSGGSDSNSNGSNSSTSKSKSGLSGGAIAGVVIGALAVLALIAGVTLSLLRRRRAAAAAPSELGAFSSRPPAEKYGFNTSEMYADGNEMMASDNKAFRHELDGSERPYEMASPPLEDQRR